MSFLLEKKIGRILNAKEEKIAEKQELAEYIAFRLLPEYPDKEVGWNAYYGTMFTLLNREG